MPYFMFIHWQTWFLYVQYHFCFWNGSTNKIIVSGKMWCQFVIFIFPVFILCIEKKILKMKDRRNVWTRYGIFYKIFLSNFFVRFFDMSTCRISIISVHIWILFCNWQKSPKAIKPDCFCFCSAINSHLNKNMYIFSERMFSELADTHKLPLFIILAHTIWHSTKNLHKKMESKNISLALTMYVLLVGSFMYFQKMLLKTYFCKI